MSLFDAASALENAAPPPKRGTVWKFVADVEALAHDIGAARFRANLPSTFGRDAVKSEQEGRTACGAVFIAPRNREISARAFWSLEWFFSRDGSEANVFEYDPIYDKFIRLQLSDILIRRRK